MTEAWLRLGQKQLKLHLRLRTLQAENQLLLLP